MRVDNYGMQQRVYSNRKNCVGLDLGDLHWLWAHLYAFLGFYNRDRFIWEKGGWTLKSPLYAHGVDMYVSRDSAGWRKSTKNSVVGLPIEDNTMRLEPKTTLTLTRTGRTNFVEKQMREVMRPPLTSTTSHGSATRVNIGINNTSTSIRSQHYI